MRIAQVAPLAESCPPRLYGGTERIVSYLTEELVRLGHEVTLFATGDSVTDARLVPACPVALRHDGRRPDPLAYMTIQLAQVARAAPQFDIVHVHWDYLHLPVFHRQTRPPVVTTLHGRLDLPHFPEIAAAFPSMPLVSISDAQRRPIPDAHWAATIHHGLPVDLYGIGSGKGGYLAFLGRISPEKRLDRAIEIARRAGLPLRVAAKIDAADRDYFETEIRPLLDDPLVTFVGEVGDAEKVAFLGNAAALLFPIDWPEPFGLVVIEAMATGTPVIAWDNGSIPELVDPGLTGEIVHSIDEAVAAIPGVIRLDRDRIRATFERRFSAMRMVDDHLDLYERLCGRHDEVIGVLGARPQFATARGSVLHEPKVHPGFG